VMHGKLDACQRELYLHPTKYWEAMQVLQDGLKERGIEHSFRTENEMNEMIRDCDYDFYQGAYSHKYM
jgi:hypothetical protein